MLSVVRIRPVLRLLALGITGILACSAAHADAKPLKLPPSQVQAFRNVRAVRITVKETLRGTNKRIEPHVRRVTTAILKASGWSVAEAAPASLEVDVSGKAWETEPAHPLTPEADQPDTVHHAKVAGQYALSANRVKLVGRLSGTGNYPLDTFLASGYLESLVATLTALRKVPAHKLVEVVVKDENATVRRYGARVLSHFKEKESVPLLVPLLKDTDDLVRAEAAGALGDLGDPKAVEPLIELVRRPGHGYDERAAIEALGMLGDPRAIVALLEFLASLQDPPERDRHAQAWYRATGAVYGLSSSVTLPEFVKALKHADAKVRRLAIDRLKSLLRADGGQNLAAKDVSLLLDSMDALLATLADADKDVRRSGAALLGTLGDGRALPALHRMAKSDPDEQVRNEARTAVNRIEWKQRESQAEPRGPQP